MSGNLKNETNIADTQFNGPSTSNAPQTHSQPTLREKAILWSLVSVAQGFGLGCVLLMVLWTVKYMGGLSWKGPNQFNFHPLLLAIGLIYLYGNAILVYRVLPNLPKIWLKILHGSLQGSALALTIIATVAIFDYKKTIKSNDMYSLHSWIGMSTIVLFGLQFVLGYGAFFVPRTPPRWRAMLLPFHRFFGVGIFVLAIATALTGTTEKLMWTKGFGSTDFNAAISIGNAYGFLLVVFGFLVVYLAVNEKYKRQPRPEDASGLTKRYQITIVQ